MAGRPARTPGPPKSESGTNRAQRIYCDTVRPADLPKLTVRFYRTGRGNEPVREWLKSLPGTERKAVGDEIRAMQFGWPIGMPLVRKLKPGLWEVRVSLDERTARVLFTVLDGEAVLLHGFIKKSQKTPSGVLAAALARMKALDVEQKRARQ